MILDFPANPPVGTMFPSAPAPGRPVWQWDGSRWNRIGVAGGDGVGPGPILSDAPSDARVYGRKDGDWAEAMSINGGVVSGSLTANAFTSFGDFAFVGPDRFIRWTGGGYLLGGDAPNGGIIATREWTDTTFMTQATAYTVFLSKTDANNTFVTQTWAETNLLTATQINDQYMPRTDALTTFATMAWVLANFEPRT